LCSALVLEVDPGADRGMNDAHGFDNSPGLAKVVAPQTNDRDFVGMPAKGPTGDHLKS